MVAIIKRVQLEKDVFASGMALKGSKFTDANCAIYKNNFPCDPTRSTCEVLEDHHFRVHCILKDEAAEKKLEIKMYESECFEYASAKDPKPGSEMRYMMLKCIQKTKQKN